MPTNAMLTKKKKKKKIDFLYYHLVKTFTSFLSPFSEGYVNGLPHFAAGWQTPCNANPSHHPSEGLARPACVLYRTTAPHAASPQDVQIQES